MATIKTFIIVPFLEMVMKVADFIPALVSVVLILVLGLILAKVLHAVIHRICKEIPVDKLSDKIGLTGLLRKGGIKHGLGELLAGFVYLVVTLSFLILALEAMGVTAGRGLIVLLMAYVPRVLSGVFVLVIGLLMTKIVSVVIHAVASNLDLPKPKLLERVSRWAVLFTTAKMALEEMGFGILFTGTVFHIWFGGVVLALALAFGLGGRDAAARYLAKKE
ncbi:MAG: hypothetical protein Q8Q08_02070 [Candidatus Omnitrophota bacterium]|nr:hypothetical protein [Candidatus Omnitrophota bacterium]MDZ4242735.1 hypothetical protein [Candidatus Omnitrophota bacterium]